MAKRDSRLKMSERARELLKRVPFNYGKVLRVYEGKDFCEYVIYYSGDTMTYRAYDNGDVFER